MGRYILHCKLPEDAPYGEMEELYDTHVLWGIDKEQSEKRRCLAVQERRQAMESIGYSVKEVAEGLRVSMGFMRRVIKKGLIKTVRLGHVYRVPRDEYDRICREGIVTEKK